MKVGPIQPYVAHLYGVSAGVASPQPTHPADHQNGARPVVLNAAEREFFTRLFPESAAYIAHHVLFTRDGHLHEPDIYKGTLIDIRV